MRRVRGVHVAAAVLILAGAGTLGGLALGASGSGTPSVLVPIVPCRLVDTRPAPLTVGTRSTPIGSGQTATFKVQGSYGDCTIPVDATGIATNITTVNPTAPSYLTVFPSGGTKPNASNLNWTASSPPTPNQVTVGLGDGGAIDVYNLTGSIDVIIDVVGYYVPESAGGGSGVTGPTGATGPAPTGRTCTATPYPGQDLADCGFTGQDLHGAVFSTAYLPYAFFNAANLTAADLSHTTMSFALLDSATATDASFLDVVAPGLRAPGLTAGNSLWVNAQLDGADLQNSALVGAAFTGASLRNVMFAGAVLVGADFAGADVTGATWTGATCPDGELAASHGQTCLGHMNATVYVATPST